jgi:hypothetical protein
MPFIKWIEMKLLGARKPKNNIHVPLTTSDVARQLHGDDETRNSETVSIVYLTMSSIQQNLIEILRSTNSNNFQV